MKLKIKLFIILSLIIMTLSGCGKSQTIDNVKSEGGHPAKLVISNIKKTSESSGGVYFECNVKCKYKGEYKDDYVTVNRLMVAMCKNVDNQWEIGSCLKSEYGSSFTVSSEKDGGENARFIFWGDPKKFKFDTLQIFIVGDMKNSRLGKGYGNIDLDRRKEYIDKPIIFWNNKYKIDSKITHIENIEDLRGEIENFDKFYKNY